MKRFVMDDWQVVLGMVVVTLGLVAVTDSGAPGTYFFSILVLTAVILWERHRGFPRS